MITGPIVSYFRTQRYTYTPTYTFANIHARVWISNRLACPQIYWNIKAHMLPFVCLSDRNSGSGLTDVCEGRWLIFQIDAPGDNNTKGTSVHCRHEYRLFYFLSSIISCKGHWPHRWQQQTFSAGLWLQVPVYLADLGTIHTLHQNGE